MLLEKCKLARRIKSGAFDDQILDLIDAAKADLKRVGITQKDESDPLIAQAIVTYFLCHFGSPDPDEYDRLNASYEQQRADLASSTGYTDWGEDDG